MNNFDFYSPTYFAFGYGQEKNIGDLVQRFGGTKILLHYGGGSIKKNGVYDAVVASLNAKNISYVELGGVQPNPRSGLVYEGIELCRREKVDFILAVGGGSAIDSAKSIAMGVPYEGDFWDIYAGTAPVGDVLPIATVLTIPAAGSEGSASAVITHEEKNLKWGSPYTDKIRPKFSVMNPKYTCTLPPYQTACGITDMMIHIFERYFTNTTEVDVTDRLCEALLLAIIKSGRRVIADPDDLDARAEIMWCGMLAHNETCGVGRKQDWASHNIEHELSMQYDVAHGAGLAVVAPAWMDYVMEHDVTRFAQVAVRVWGCEMDFAHPERTAREGISRFRSFLQDIGMPITLKELGAKLEDMPAMIENRAKRGFPIGQFVRLGSEDMEKILILAQ